ncbi:MAG: hypothetical protein KKA84_10955 [Bacteroidetes bacterium]|nr:hypothetical protein [Bacteroidota bacterium]
MKKYLLFLLLISYVHFAQTPTVITYDVDLTNYLDDLFHVTVYPVSLSAENNMYHFPANVPGTYGRENFGRFVHDLKALDVNGNEILTEKVSDNSWLLNEPEKIFKLTYNVEDTYDSEVDGGNVMPMSGTGIDSNYVVLNTHGVAGYFEGQQFEPLQIKVEYKSEWTLGTSLEEGSNGYFIADNYNELVDNPILIGELTHSTFMVNQVEVNIYVYSTNEGINAAKLAEVSNDVLQASEEFIGYSPVAKYSFLMCFWDMEYARSLNFRGFGALEHNTSSLYALPLFGDPENQLLDVRETMTHEFCHILTPLNLRSEKISKFNFIEPEASEHLWLYEGVTEWASNILLMRGGKITLEEYLKMQSQKIEEGQELDQTISLSELSLNIYSPEYAVNFIDFYRRGAIVAALLDIRLLELSGGERGLREVFMELIKEHGENKPFDDKTFFDLLVEKTYPEIKDFIDNYIKGTSPLPIADYFRKIGINYYPSRISKDPRPTFGIWIASRPDKYNFIRKIYDEAKVFGYQVDDTVLEMQGIKLEPRNMPEVFKELYSKYKMGDDVKVKVKRGDEEIELDAKLIQRLDFYVFEVDENPTTEQLKLREAWMKNL